MSEREQFEAAWIAANSDSKEKADKVRDALRNIWRDNGSAGGAYFDSFVMMAWTWWKASREALKAEQGGDGWISCADRMPERGGQYCVWNGAHVGLVTYLFGSFQCLYPEQITHWQQQPSPPSHHPIDTTPNQYDALGKGER